MTASITDVAERAGVSVATVSRALRGLPNVAEATRRRVVEAASELDYVVNPNASRLAAGHNHTLGVVVPSVASWYFQEVLAGAQTVFEAQGYDMLLYDVAAPASRERFLTVLPFRKRVDGLLLLDLPLEEDEMAVLASTGARLVAVGPCSGLFPSVGVDDVTAAGRATRFLLDLGHRRIGLLAGGLTREHRHQGSVDRRSGWLDALRAAGVDPEPGWEQQGVYTLRDGVDGLHALRSADPSLTAVLCMSDELAIGALHGLRESGLSCPSDMSVIGFDDHEVAEYVGLTTVRQPMRLLGQTAAEMLLALVRGDEVSSQPRRLPTSLVVRETTSPLDPDRRTALNS